MRNGLFGLGFAVITAGCGISVPNEGAVAEPFWLDGGSADGGSDATVAVPADGTDEYFAFWDQTRVLAHNTAPIGDEWQPSRTTTIGLLRVHWQGNSGQAWLVPCAVHSTDIASSTLTYPPDFIDALAEGPLPMQRDGATLTLPAKTQWLGLPRGYLGDLPAVGDGANPAIIDQDGDGHPGVTIFIHMPFFGDQAIYVVERQTTAWTAQRNADGTVVALPQTTGGKVTVGATQSLLVTANTDKALDGEPPEELRLTPTSGATGCSALLAAPQQLIGQSWPP